MSVLAILSGNALAGETKPFGGKPQVIPGAIEAEHFDEGAPGTAYLDVDSKNQGAPYRGTESQVDIEARGDASNKHGLGWTRAGEWLVYTVDVKEAGTYTVEIAVASEKEGGIFHLEFNGKDKTGPIQLPDSSAWTKLKTIKKTGIKLDQGVQTMKLMMDTDGIETKSTGDIDVLKFTRE